MRWVWEWPQITWAVMVAFNMLFTAVMDGEPKKGKHSLALALLCLPLSFAMLYFGGFFTEGRP